MYELIIIGGGPAGAAAGVYAARKQIKTALIAESFGGQSVESEEIQNWIGTTAISGLELAKKLKEHVKFYADKFVNLREGERVNVINKTEEGFEVITNKDTYKTKTILVATGGTRRKLEIPGAKEFEGRGITYCASCDGPFFADKDVLVIGGGNSAFESAAQLLAYCKSVTLLARGEFRADPVTVEKVLANPKMKAIENAQPIEVKGNIPEDGDPATITTLIYQKTAPFVVDNLEIATQGIFVEIGHLPATNFVENVVRTDEFKRIMVDHKDQRTSEPGIWAAGDCTNGLYHQNNIAAGDAVKAIEDIYLELQKKK